MNGGDILSYDIFFGESEYFSFEHEIKHCRSTISPEDLTLQGHSLRSISNVLVQNLRTEVFLGAGLDGC